MAFVHLFNDNFDDNYDFLSSYWSKTMERENEREMITTCQYEKESCQNVVKKWLFKYYFSDNNDRKKFKLTCGCPYTLGAINATGCP